MRGAAVVFFLFLFLFTVAFAEEETEYYYYPFKEDYYSCFFDAGYYYGVNPYLLIAIAQVESRMNPKALNRNRNGSYDIGIMQVNTSWIPYLRSYGIHPGYLWYPCYNIYVGAMVLRHCMDIYGNTWRAVDCYNKGKNAKKVSLYVWKVYNTLKSFGYYATETGYSVR